MNTKKVLFLGLLLVVPVLVFLLLKGLGTNRYDLRYYYPEVTDEGEALVQKGDTVFRRVPDFKLTSQEGKTVTQHDLDDKIYVANFIFTSCQGICKKMTSQMTRVQDRFKNDPSVKIVSYTVDPERDSVETLHQYASLYNADPKMWYFLTGPKKEIYDLAQHGYLLPVQESNDGTVDFVHSEKFMLVDKDKHVRGIYDGTIQKEVDRLITEITVLQHAYKQNEK
ncbi:SCO family protein [Adhaeribacter sp. BT258]|uniref:SCO family protein n=1 Tax=Adhaeribacter terrigena TaxID=2793070 RepID=A0ABS1BYR1_9BACT|nr:SCO family protein [Adhaeribacter terrigena]MBK0402313.1 SCO family protein [Adhaeribacter terrigena]